VIEIELEGVDWIQPVQDRLNPVSTEMNFPILQIAGNFSTICETL
jgi:hypothetical protein